MNDIKILYFIKKFFVKNNKMFCKINKSFVENKIRNKK